MPARRRIERMPIEIENPSEKGLETEWQKKKRQREKRRKEEKELPAQDHCLPAFMCTAVSSPESGLFDVSEVEVENNSYYTAEQIIEKSGLKTGENIFECRTRKLKEALSCRYLH